LAAQALDRGDVGEAAELLERHLPGAPGLAGISIDPRGFEWSYLMRRTRRDRQVLNVSDRALHAVAVRPDRNQLATAGEGGTVYRIDGENLQLASSLETELFEINALAYSPDGTRLAIGGDSGKVEVWTLSDRSLASRFLFSERRVIDLLFALDGNQLIVSGAIPEVRLFDWRSGERMATLAVHQRSIETLAISPDGAWLACGSDDSTVSVWDWREQRLLHRTAPSDGRITAVDFSPDGKELFDASVKGLLRVFETDRWRPAGQAEVPSAVQSIAVSPDGGELVAGCRTGIAHRFRLSDVESRRDTSAAECLRFIEGMQVHDSRIHDLAWLDGRRAVSIGRDGHLVVLDRETQETTTAPTAAPAKELAVSHDGRWIATHNYEQAILIDTTTSEVYQVAETEAGFAGIEFTPDGEAVLVATADGQVARVEVDRERRVSWRDAPVAADFAKLAFSADGRRLMLFSRANDIALVVDYPSWSPLFQTDCPDAHTGSLSSDGRYLATSYRRDAKVYDVDSGRLVAESPDHHHETINDIRFGPNDEWIATTSDDRSVKIWNPWNGHGPQLIGVHPEGVPRGLSISSDGRTLLTDSKEGSIWAWSVPARQKLFPIVRSPEGFWFSELSAQDSLFAYVEVGGRLRWLRLE
jgi:WD40 repeat protein